MFSTVLSRFLAVGPFHSFYIFSTFLVSSCSWTISLILHIQQFFFSLFLQLDYFTHFTYSAVVFLVSSCSWTISLILHIPQLLFFSLFLQLDYFTHFTYSAGFFFCFFFNVFLQLDYFTHFTYSTVTESFSCSWTISPILHIQHYVESFSCSWTISPILHSTMLSLFLAAEHATPRQLGLVLRRVCGPP